MHRPERILLALLGGALAGVALWKAPPWLAARAAGPAEAWELPGAADGRADARVAPPRSRAEDQRAFLALLQRFRSGEDAALDDLRAAARVMAEAHDGAAYPGLVDYYAALAPGARKVGLRDEGVFRELWARVRDAPREEGAWATEREEVLAELRELAARALARPDFGPAGRALSLCARIEVEQLEKSARLSADERDALLERAEQDARQALAVFERAGFETPRLEPEWILGRLASLRCERREAAERFERVRVGAARARVSAFREHALYGLLRLAKEASDLDRVDGLLAELAELHGPRESWTLAREQAWRMVQDDDAPGAIEFLLRNRPEREDEVESWHAMLARAQLRAGELRAARAQLARLDPARHHEDVVLVGAQLDLQEGRPERALAALDRPDVLAALAPPARVFALALLGEALLDVGSPAEALRELERAMDLAEDVETRLAAERGLREGGAWIAGEHLGLHAVALAGRALAELGDPLAAAARVEAWQARGLRGRGGAAELGPGDVAAWAARYELGLLACVAGADSALVVHVAPDGVAEARVVPRRRVALRRAVRRLREAAVAGDEARARALGAELADALLPDGLRAPARGGARRAPAPLAARPARAPARVAARRRRPRARRAGRDDRARRPAVAPPARRARRRRARALGAARRPARRDAPAGRRGGARRARAPAPRRRARHRRALRPARGRGGAALG